MNTRKYSNIAPVIWQEKNGLLQLLGLAILAACVTALMPWPIKLLVDYALVEPTSLSPDVNFFMTPAVLIGVAAVASVLLFAVSSGLSVASSWLWSKTGQQMVLELSMLMFNKLQRLSKLFHTKHPIADSLGRLTVDSWCVFTIAQALLITPAQNLITILVIGLVAWQIDPFLTVLSLLLSPMLAASTIFFGGRLRARAQSQRKAQSNVMSFVHQTITAIPLVQAFGRERANCERFRDLSHKAIKSAKVSSLYDNGFTFVNAATLSTGLTIVLIAGGQRVLDGTITVGSLLVFLGYLQTLQGETESLLLTYKNVKSAEANLDRVSEVLDAKEEISDHWGARTLTTDSLNSAVGVRFENVTFSYEADRPVLNNISLEIKPGETVAFVGKSGSGKSTLASLIMRFFDWDSGNIYLGDENIYDVDLKSLRDRISVVLQDPFLLPLTIAENIAYGTPDATREEIIRAATTASAAAFISKLPDGYDTTIGEKGANISGGQRQRLAIARAILKNAPILILDEPTSALDARTETLFFEALSKLMQGRTTIIVAHRLSTIRDADRIFVIDKGKVAESGNHSDLINRNGIYAEMVQLQSPQSSQEAA